MLCHPVPRAGGEDTEPFGGMVWGPGPDPGKRKKRETNKTCLKPQPGEVLRWGTSHSHLFLGETTHAAALVSLSGAKSWRKPSVTAQKCHPARSYGSNLLSTWKKTQPRAIKNPLNPVHQALSEFTSLNTPLKEGHV